MKKAFSTLQSAVVICLNLMIIGWTCYLVIGGYGSRWEFGPHGLPVTPLSPDWQTYRDGSPINGIARGLALSGGEEKFWLFMFTFYAVMIFYICRINRDIKRKQKINAMWNLACNANAAGDRQTAQAAFSGYRQMQEEEQRRAKSWRRWF